jgi:hypothetical protein
MERHGAISKKSLNFCDKEVPLFEEIPHLELIALQLATLRADGVGTCNDGTIFKAYPPGHLQGD